jgi:hypothetical protein
METITIFLASSNELEDDRKAFESFLYRKSKLWLDERNVFLELKNWEDFIDAVSKTRLQNEYNQAIRDSDIFVMLFWTKVGMYTNEEFDVAHTQFLQTGKPLIYTYFKELPSGKPGQDSLEIFSNKLLGMQHFKTPYKNTEGFLLHFDQQLDKLYRLKIPSPEQKGLEQKISKDELNKMLNRGEILEVLQELIKLFDDKNIRLNVLMDEFVNPPNNFSQVQFITRLKLFISISLD